MLVEAKLFDPSERYFIDRSVIDEIAVPVGDYYGDEVFSDYLSYYAGVARRYKPKRLFEIGARYGYNLICMAYALHKLPGAPKPEIIGIDDESYHSGSCDRANQNFAQVIPWCNAQCIKCRSWDGLPPDIGTFGFISIDAHHTREAILCEAPQAWPLLEEGGILYFDDATPGNSVHQGILEFLTQFENTPETVYFQELPNLRDHFIVKKGD